MSNYSISYYKANYDYNYDYDVLSSWWNVLNSNQYKFIVFYIQSNFNEEKEYEITFRAKDKNKKEIAKHYVKNKTKDNLILFRVDELRQKLITNKTEYIEVDYSIKKGWSQLPTTIYTIIDENDLEKFKKEIVLKEQKEEQKEKKEKEEKNPLNQLSKTFDKVILLIALIIILAVIIAILNVASSVKSLTGVAK
jgi:ABC-type bacteriocin/lantibiotic exporter with double-glycine peptidase domain